MIKPLKSFILIETVQSSESLDGIKRPLIKRENELDTQRHTKREENNKHVENIHTHNNRLIVNGQRERAHDTAAIATRHNISENMLKPMCDSIQNTDENRRRRKNKHKDCSKLNANKDTIYDRQDTHQTTRTHSPRY